jgi:integrase
MAKDVLTDKGIKAMKPADKPYKKSDGGGMFLLVQPNGTKIWQLGYRFGGKQRTFSIGIYPDVPLALARDRRNEARKLLARGIDPHAEKMAEKAAKVPEKTFGKFADEWLAKEGKTNAKRTMLGKRHRVDLLKDEFGKMALADITRAAVLDFVRKLEAKGILETRDRVRANGESIYDFAVDDDIRPNPFQRFGKDKLIAKKSAPRPAAIKPADVARLFKAVAVDRQDKGINEVVTFGLRMLALCAVRPGELRNMEWSEIDREAALWTIPGSKMKMGREHCVPLSRQALEILDRMQAISGGQQYVFPSNRACRLGEPLEEHTLNDRLRFLGFDTAGENGHCAHGFRSTFSTLLNRETKMVLDAEGNKKAVKVWDRDLIELQLAHVDRSSVRGIYNRVDSHDMLEPRATMMQAWADKIDIIVNSSDPVPLRKADVA